MVIEGVRKPPLKPPASSGRGPEHTLGRSGRPEQPSNRGQEPVSGSPVGGQNRPDVKPRSLSHGAHRHVGQKGGCTSGPEGVQQGYNLVYSYNPQDNFPDNPAGYFFGALMQRLPPSDVTKLPLAA